jgi:IS5 family transposase
MHSPEAPANKKLIYTTTDGILAANFAGAAPRGEGAEMLKGGAMVDATIIHAAPSTKNQAQARDPEMHQTKKGNQWFFGMKVHVGADVHTGVAHTVSVTPAHAADISQLPNLLREDDRMVLGDAGYVNDTYKRAARQAGVVWGVALKARPKRRLGAAQKRRNRRMSSIRSRVEHLFRVMERQFGYTKTRYRVLAQNAAQAFILMGLTNLYLKRHALMT